jgi:hypothetical protein
VKWNITKRRSEDMEPEQLEIEEELEDENAPKPV